MKRFLFAAALTILGGATYAGPFGLEMGTPLAELDVAESGAQVRLNSVPKPHRDFKTYAVWAPDKTGVCLILGISKEYINDRYGNAIQSDIKGFAAALDKKYGPHETVDLLRSGAIWDEPEDWIMSVKQSERVFGHFWSSPKDGASENLSYIEMDVLALSGDSAVIRLTYKSNEIDACVAAIEAEANSSF